MAWATTPNAPPVVATPAAASAAPVTGSSVALSVMGADDQGEGNLSYTWATTGSPAAPVAFTANGTNADKTVGATFSKAGLPLPGDDHRRRRPFDHQRRDRDGRADLHRRFRYAGLPRVTDKQTDQFAAAAVDQFGDPMQQQPAFAWSLAAGSPGSVDAGGLYTAPDAGVGDVTVQAAAGGLSGSADVALASDQPTLTATAVNDPSTSAPEIQVAYGEAGDSNLTLYEKGPSDDNFARVATDPSTGRR